MEMKAKVTMTPIRVTLLSGQKNLRILILNSLALMSRNAVQCVNYFCHLLSEKVISFVWYDINFEAH